MNVHYYNEWDKGAAAWLRELINNKLIPYGYVDERSITEVTPSDLEGFTQCHFFAGIGGWPLALKLAGVPASTRLWTGSPPCQPFSVAGQSRGFDDQRHLAPAFLRLIRECKPELLFGEQVAAAIGKHWLDFVFLNLEDKDYACGSAVLPACSVGAPHKRDRLFFGASQLGYANSERRNRQYSLLQRSAEENMSETTWSSENLRMGDTDSERLQREWRNSNQERRKGQNFRQTGLLDGAGPEDYATNPHNSFWSDADWLGCRDGKFRPVEPGTFPLANGVPARVGRLRGYGNAIVPQVAAEFVKAFMESIK
ncbi:DNA cytosine methyltransferase [Escherichia coli]|uniref:DNA cytosine methyltransferase n=1 Tax=Escherichia coli TaxID=562 RepID=UPI001F560A40|nr:DNA cytosine methyltransferase [Escherichia coli]MCI2234043.1 DNA cytosine methyltransferase [Escherichia coli]